MLQIISLLFAAIILELLYFIIEHYKIFFYCTLANLDHHVKLPLITVIWPFHLLDNFPALN